MMIIMVLSQHSRKDSRMENIWEFQQDSNFFSNGKLFIFDYLDPAQQYMRLSHSIK